MIPARARAEVLPDPYRTGSGALKSKLLGNLTRGGVAYLGVEAVGPGAHRFKIDPAPDDMPVYAPFLFVLIDDAGLTCGNASVLFENLESPLPLFLGKSLMGAWIEIRLIEEILAAREARILLHFEERVLQILGTKAAYFFQLGPVVFLVIRQMSRPEPYAAA